ncbi:unnamed protein product [marine sediment metagenome]|uniref:Uncharacterized protein n=1 Tax=marine sediment metagenome TaxID=412755 RepID=X1GJT5_9ZZZZ
MQDTEKIKIFKIACGVFLCTLYAVTGMNGIILVMSAFLLGIPLEEFAKRLTKD